MALPFIAGNIAKAITSKKRSRKFWNIFFSSSIAALVLLASYMYYMCISSGEDMLLSIVLTSLIVIPLLGYFVFMLVVTNIKNPGKKIDKLQRTYLLRFYDSASNIKREKM